MLSWTMLDGKLKKKKIAESASLKIEDTSIPKKDDEKLCLEEVTNRSLMTNLNPDIS